ncbi:hypothetical protein ASG52_14540 [Methylobacterium sp. Leaf456]|uniref:energy transducer TonB family protein n=1 Tax=Methylobacterium sp. Leaf456 TaxID=1736382 RepID=UPI0006FB8E2D|nr:energy transducer TonB [Methylobacterium sp. Leaf456]KQT45383.1 hypothetical protein ASG52_14540 [Methylobacterium sp. Leaf456]
MVLLLLCLGAPAAAQATDATDAAGMPAYRQQLTRLLTAKVRNLRHRTAGGTVLVRFVVGRNGIVTQSEIATSSGAQAIDRLASRIVPVGLKLPPLPAEAPIPSLAVTLPLHFDGREAPMTESLRAYHRELLLLFARRIQGLPHRMLIGGRLAVRFTVEREGSVTYSAIARSSGSQTIDELGLRIVPIGLKAPPIPPELPAPMHVTLPLQFGLAPNT